MAEAKLIAADANLGLAKVKGAQASGGRSNEWGFSNRMLDTAIALMAAK